MKQQLRTVLIFTKLSTRRFFRDRLALFFGILFPLIFLFVFGSISRGGGDPEFKVALINQSQSTSAVQLDKTLRATSALKIDDTLKTVPEAKAKLNNGQIDGIIVFSKEFGAAEGQQAIKVLYAQSSNGTGETLVSLLSGFIEGVNQKAANFTPPYKVVGSAVNDEHLKPFDYTFAGLLGFSILGIGIFGPINVFPELKKMGILRRLHTTPLKVWQYFLATMFSQAITGVVSIAIQFAVAIAVFDLHVAGNYFEIVLYTVLSIFMILGIGLAIGGWARNERQAAPLTNIIVFPMMFLSGTFFPRFAMPVWLQHVSDYLPLTPVIDGLRMLTTQGAHFVDILPQLGLLGAWMVVVYFIAFRVFRWE